MLVPAVASSTQRLQDLSCVSFLTAYAQPAFVVQRSKPHGQSVPSINPIFGNNPYRRLLFGPDADTAELGVAFLRALESVEQAEQYGKWLELSKTPPPQASPSDVSETAPAVEEVQSLCVKLRIAWLPPGADLVELELWQTLVEDYIVCTSAYRSPAPKYSPPLSFQKPVFLESGLTDRGMRIPDFPSLAYLVDPSSSSPAGGAAAVASSSAWQSAQGTRMPIADTNVSYESPVTTGAPQTMREMVQNYPWDTTPLGPRSNWSSSLYTAVDYILSHPWPKALWWGKELVLLYNDAYKELIAHKHPHIFAEHGSVSWAELWDTLGPQVEKVFDGAAVWKMDDLLFLARMTKARLPEETYQSWNWVPFRAGPGRTVQGFINGTIETTTKVVTERRMNFLREVSSKAALGRSSDEFADLLMLVLASNMIDCTFAAFYFASIIEAPRSESSETADSYIKRTSRGSPIKVKLMCRGTVGVPMPHPSVPEHAYVSLDPFTLRPSPQQIARNGSPVPSILSQGSSATALPNLQMFSREGAESPLAVPFTATVSTSSPVTTPSGCSSSGSSSGRLSTPSIPSSSSPSAGSLSRIHSSPSVRASSSDSSADSRAFWPFADVLASKNPIHVPTLPDYVVEGFEMRGWGEPAKEAVLIPITLEGQELPSAVLVMGLNSRKPYDAEYQAFIDLFRLTMNNLLFAVRGRESDLLHVKQLTALDSAKTVFFSNASHELRTPLTLIQGPLLDTLAVLPDSKAKDNLKMAARNLSRLSRLVDSLMDFSKLAANKLEGRFKLLPLGEYTADLASLFRSVIEKSAIEYVVKCDLSNTKQAYVDPEFWEKIVFNIIGNAFKYTLEGSIHVTLEYDADFAYFHVRDTGVGVPESDIDKIFQRFHRVDASSRSYEGTGIGLALTWELVKLHGGTLSVVSSTADETPDGSHGSHFTVSLPLGKEHLAPAHIVQPGPSPLGNRREHTHQQYARGIVEEATHWASMSHPPDELTPSDSGDSGSGSSDSGSRMDPNTLFFVKSDVILLVDDNADMRRYIKSLFVPFCQFVEASNGQEALKLLDKVRPNLILSDVMMPVLDGYGLIQQVKRRPETKHTPIILVTAKESEDARVEGLLSGADDYLSKPFTGKELIARVNLQMQLGKRRIELEAGFAERTREIQLLSDLSPVGISRVNADRQELYTNQKWYELSGLDPKISNDHWFECIREDDRQMAKDMWEAAFESHKALSTEFQFVNGIYAKWSCQPLRSPDGDLTGLISTITDVSDQRMFEATRLAHAQEREALARKRAEEAEERRQEADERRRGQELLIDVTSHELRQPVSAILNCSSLVRQNCADLVLALQNCVETGTLYQPTKKLLKSMDEDIDAMDAIYQCGLAQERIANDVLSLSRIQLQILSVHPVEFELIPEVQRIISIFRNELKMKRIKLELTFGPSFNKFSVTRVLLDKSRFAQVLTNLLSNGIKFTDTSSDRREISVVVNVSWRAPTEDGPCVPPEEDALDASQEGIDKPQTIYVYVSVQDSGPGLKPDDLALLFKRFQQGSNSHNVFGGSGLGLFVSRKLCDLMNGRIDVTSTYGSGAQFRFFVEATAVPVNSEGTGVGGVAGHSHVFSPRDSSIILSSPTTARKRVNAASSLHILITEDNLINQTVLNRQLQKEGCSTTLANNGLQALNKVKELAVSEGKRKSFDVILMDCEMPVMDGLTAVREIRRLEETGLLPKRTLIFALTGNAREGQIYSAREAGMDDVIIKPYKLDELLLKINDTLESRGLSPEPEKMQTSPRTPTPSISPTPAASAP